VDKLGMVMDVARKCSTYPDLVGGSDMEYELLNYVLSLIDNPRLTYELQPIVVLHWRDIYSRVEAGGRDFRALSVPLTLGGYVEGPLTEDPGDVEGKVLLTDFPEDMDDAKYIYIDSTSRGAQGVIFRDRYPGVVRRIVITGGRDYTWRRGPAPTIPALAVSREVGDELRRLGGTVRMTSEVETRLSTGYNLIVELQGDSNDVVILGAHHDHWLSGYSDDCLGLGVGLVVLKGLIGTELRRGLRFISFTAEEIGDPGFATLYWAYGSRRYVEGLDDLEHVFMMIDVDVVGRQFVLHTTSDISAQLKVNAQWELPKPYFDSLNFEMMGIPSITLSSLDAYWDVYHTDRDQEDSARPEYVESALGTIEALVRDALYGEFGVGNVIRMLQSDLASVGLVGDYGNDWRSYRELRRLLSKHLVEYRRDGSVRHVYTDSIISYLRRFLSVNNMAQVPLRVEVLGSGDVLMDTSTLRSVNALREYVNYILESVTQDIAIEMRS